MSFHYPSILWGLLAVLIPIIIHLFNFRRIRKVYFPTLAFLQEVLKKNQRRSDLKHLLVLFTRILAIASLVIAFAGPFIPSKDQEFDLAGDRPVSIYLDNSFSMQAGSSFEANFQKAKEELRRLLAALPSGTRYQFINNDQNPGSSLFLSKDDLLDELNELQISPVHKEVTQMIALQQHQMPKRERDKAVYFVISDFQDFGSHNDSGLESDTSGQYLFLPVSTALTTSNISIDSAWFDSPVRHVGAANNLIIKVSNFGEEDLEKVSVRLYLDGVQQTAMTTDLPAKGSSSLKLPLVLKKEGFQRARLEVSDYPVTFDDSYDMVWETSKKVDIVHIRAETSGGYMQKLFGSDSSFALHEYRQGRIDFDAFKDAKFIVLENLTEITSGMASELNEFLLRGGTVLLFPSSSGKITTYNDWLVAHGARYLDLDTSFSMVDLVNLDHQIFQGVFEKDPDNMELPAVYKSFPIEVLSANVSVLLRYRIDRPFIAELPAEAGHLFVCASPLDDKATTLPNHSLFVYLALNMALQSGGHQALAFPVKQGLNIPLGDIRLESDQVPILKSIDGSSELIPEINRTGRETNLIFNHALPESGIYQLWKGEETFGELAFNYGREESRIDFPAKEDIESWVEGLTAINKVFVLSADKMPLDVKLKNEREGYGLSLWFIIAALIFLLTEVLLLRWL